MEYALSEEQILEILKEGKFDKEKYLKDAIVQRSFIEEGLRFIIDNYYYGAEEEVEELEKALKDPVKKEEIYKEIANTFCLRDSAYQELEDSLDESYKDYIENWLENNKEGR